jgi:hypothetical protein
MVRLDERRLFPDSEGAVYPQRDFAKRKGDHQRDQQ